MTRISLRIGRRAMASLGALLLSGLAACSGSHPDTASQPSGTTMTPPLAIRYVSPTGHDDGPGTKDQPWQTLRRALPALRNGQLLYVRGGDYFERFVQIPIHRGTPNHHITVMAYPGERPVVHGQLWLRRPSYWDIDGLNVTWDPDLSPAPHQMVKVTGGVGWTWKNSEIWGSHGTTNFLVAGYGRQEPARWTVAGNCIHDVQPPTGVKRTSDFAIGDMKSGGPGSVTRNLIFGAPAQIVAIGSAAGGPTDVTMDYNTVYGGGVAVVLAGDSKTVRITRNVLGGVARGLLIRWGGQPGLGNVVTQNLGVQATIFLRPAAAGVIGGPGNIIDSGVMFSGVSACNGFRTKSPAAIPYGQHAVG
jgi:hypothetical protein